MSNRLLSIPHIQNEECDPSTHPLPSQRSNLIINPTKLLQGPHHRILLILIERNTHEKYVTQTIQKRKILDLYHIPNDDSKQYVREISYRILFCQQSENSLSIVSIFFVYYLDRKVEYRTFRLDTLTDILWLLIRRAVDERKKGVQKGIHIPLGIKQYNICNQTGQNLVPSKLIITFLFLGGRIIQLVLVKVQNL